MREVVSKAEAYRLAEAEELLLQYEGKFGSRPESMAELERAVKAGEIGGEGKVVPSEQAMAWVREHYTVNG